jgi:hypothetical protein
MRIGADFAVIAPHGGLALIAEAKAKVGASPTWAAQLRRNLMTHWGHARSKYFLLAMPDKFYLWKDGANLPAETPADFEIDAKEFLGPYFEAANVSPESVSGYGFELIVAAWLHALLASDDLPAELLSKHPWLVELFDEIKGGHVAPEVGA